MHTATRALILFASDHPDEAGKLAMTFGPAEAISLVSLVVAGIALWRTEVARVQDKREGVQKTQEGVLLALDQLTQRIPMAVQSRQRVAAAIGNTGATEAFGQAAQADLLALVGLRTRVNDVGQISSSAAASDAAVELHRVEVAVKQMEAKYDSSWAEDEAQRAHLRAAASARVAASISAGKGPR